MLEGLGVETALAQTRLVYPLSVFFEIRAMPHAPTGHYLECGPMRMRDERNGSRKKRVWLARLA